MPLKLKLFAPIFGVLLITGNICASELKVDGFTNETPQQKFLSNNAILGLEYLVNECPWDSDEKSEVCVVAKELTKKLTLRSRSTESKHSNISTEEIRQLKRTCKLSKSASEPRFYICQLLYKITKLVAQVELGKLPEEPSSIDDASNPDAHDPAIDKLRLVVNEAFRFINSPINSPAS